MTKLNDPPPAQQSLFDSLLSPEIDKPLANFTHLFSIEHIGKMFLTNMLIPGCFSKDADAKPNIIAATMFFEDAKNQPEIYSILQMGMYYTLMVGDQPQQSFHLNHNRIHLNSIVETRIKLKKLHVPRRQSFGLYVYASPTVVDLVNRLKGRKFMRLRIESILTPGYVDHGR